LRNPRADVSNPIQHSLELATGRCADITPLVYDRLFRTHAETESMFARDTGGHIKGAMLAFAIDAILDFAGERSGTFRMIACEVQSHEAYGTSRELFFAFFDMIRETLRELLGADWSAEFDEAWRTLLDEIARDTASA
jgi:hemoglobin-like flavoprotein